MTEIKFWGEHWKKANQYNIREKEEVRNHQADALQYANELLLTYNINQRNHEMTRATETDTTINAIQAQQGMTTCEVTFETHLADDDTRNGSQRYTYKISKNDDWQVGDYAIVRPSHGQAKIVRITKIATVPKLEHDWRLGWLLVKVTNPYSIHKQVQESEEALRNNIINASAMKKAEALIDALDLQPEQKKLPVTVMSDGSDASQQ